MSIAPDKEMYAKIIKEKQCQMNKFLNEVRERVITRLGAKRIGVFGPYKDSIQGISCKDIICNLAESFVNQGFVVITGIGVFASGSGMADLFTHLSKFICVLEPTYAAKDIYKFLATFAPYAVFIETISRSTSIYEEESFYDNVTFDNLLGVGFLISDEEPLNCTHLKKDNVDSTDYWTCEGTTVKNCEENKNACPFYKAGIPYGNINMFVINEFMQLAIVKNYKHIPHVMQRLMNT